MPRIAIVTFYTDTWSKVGALVDQNKLDYARAHEYSFSSTVPTEKDLAVMGRPPAWFKVPLLQRHVQNSDWTLWTDADSVVVDHDVRLEDLVDDEHDVVLSLDPVTGVNTGNMLLKNSEWTGQLLKHLWDYPLDITNGLYSQWAFMEMMKDLEFANHVKVLPQRVLNAWDVGPGAFIRHFAGQRNVDRLFRLIDDVLFRAGKAATKPSPAPTKARPYFGLRSR